MCAGLRPIFFWHNEAQPDASDVLGAVSDAVLETVLCQIIKIETSLLPGVIVSQPTNTTKSQRE